VLLAVLMTACAGYLHPAEYGTKAAAGSEQGRNAVVLSMLTSLVMAVQLFGLMSSHEHLLAIGPLYLPMLETWLAGAVIGALAMAVTAWHRVGLYVLSLPVTMLAALAQAGWLAAADRLYSSGDLPGMAERLARLPVLQLALIVVLMTMTAAVLQPPARPRPEVRRARLAPAALVLACLPLLALAVRGNLRLAAADTLIKTAIQEPQPQLSEMLFAQACRLRPDQDSYLEAWTRADIAEVARNPDPVRQEHLLARAEARCAHAQRRNPYNLRHLVMRARILRTWGLASQDQEQREQKLREALAAIERAVELTPKVALLHNQHGFLLARLGRPSQTLDAFHRSLSCNPELAETYLLLGNLLADQAQAAAQAGLADEARRLADLADEARQQVPQRPLSPR
jgi:tetratricopeptide (TPR) repeat protein